MCELQVFSPLLYYRANSLLYNTEKDANGFEYSFNWATSEGFGKSSEKPHFIPFTNRRSVKGLGLLLILTVNMVRTDNVGEKVKHLADLAWWPKTPQANASIILAKIEILACLGITRATNTTPIYSDKEILLDVSPLDLVIQGDLCTNFRT